MARWALAIGFVITTISSVSLLRANQRLERELAHRPAASDGSCESPGAAGADSELEPMPGQAPALERLARRLEIAGARRQATVDDPPAEGDNKSTGERWQEAQDEIDAVFSRDPGETVEQYRERVVPLVRLGLAGVRERTADQRSELESLAGVTAEQRAEIDQVIDDAYREALAFTNQAIQSGEINPSNLEWGNLLVYGGGLGSVLDSAESQLGEILTPEQRDVFVEQGFRWSQYLGANMPWEDLEPPPAIGEVLGATPVEPE